MPKKDYLRAIGIDLGWADNILLLIVSTQNTVNTLSQQAVARAWAGERQGDIPVSAPLPSAEEELVLKRHQELHAKDPEAQAAYDQQMQAVLDKALAAKEKAAADQAAAQAATKAGEEEAEQERVRANGAWSNLINHTDLKPRLPSLETKPDFQFQLAAGELVKPFGDTGLHLRRLEQPTANGLSLDGLADSKLPEVTNAEVERIFTHGGQIHNNVSSIYFSTVQPESHNGRLIAETPEGGTYLLEQFFDDKGEAYLAIQGVDKIGPSGLTNKLLLTSDYSALSSPWEAGQAGKTILANKPASRMTVFKIDKSPEGFVPPGVYSYLWGHGGLTTDANHRSPFRKYGPILPRRVAYTNHYVDVSRLRIQASGSKVSGEAALPELSTYQISNLLRETRASIANQVVAYKDPNKPFEHLYLIDDKAGNKYMIRLGVETNTSKLDMAYLEAFGLSQLSPYLSVTKVDDNNAAISKTYTYKIEDNGQGFITNDFLEQMSGSDLPNLKAQIFNQIITIPEITDTTRRGLVGDLLVYRISNEQLCTFMKKLNAMIRRGEISSANPLQLL